MRFNTYTVAVAMLASGLAACAQPGSRNGNASASEPDADESAILDSVPTAEEAAAQAENEINENNSQKILNEIRREVGG